MILWPAPGNPGRPIPGGTSLRTNVPKLLSLWAGLLPFLLFCLLFLILPTFKIVTGAFQAPDGTFTLDNIRMMNSGNIPSAFWVSIKISFVSALLGGVAGFAVSAALAFGAVPKALRGAATTFSGVAANFAGVPLAFAFIATLGPVGLVNVMLRSNNMATLQQMGFSIYGFWGLTMAYVFFQLPLMILMILPALDGLKREWREAAAILGASGAQYWRMIALPILTPALLGTFALLFANAFGAVATAMALTGANLNIVPILLFAQIRGDVLGNPHLGYALAFGMIVVTAVANTLYIWLRVRSERWLK